MKRGCHRWILAPLLTFYSYSLSNKRRCHGADLVCIIRVSAYKFTRETWLSWKVNCSFINIFFIYVITSTSVTERYSFVYLRYHYISTKVKHCYHGWIIVRLLTILYIRDHVNVVVLELYSIVILHFHHISTKVKPLSWMDSCSFTYIFFIYVFTSTSLSWSYTRLFTHFFSI